MLRSFRAWLAGALVLCAASILFAQATADRYANPPDDSPAGAVPETIGWTEQAGNTAPAGPPAWNDGASVYLTERPATCEHPSGCGCGDRYNDPRVSPAAFAQEAPATDSPSEPGRLAAPTRTLRPASKSASTSGDSSWGLPTDSLVTTITALVLVIGLFLMCAWALRRGSSQPAGTLPQDVVGVLGTTQLGGRNLAQLLRIGNKLVLVSLAPGAAGPIAEVTDPAEVERLLGLCLQGGSRGSLSLGPAKLAGLYGAEQTTPNFDAAYRQLTPAPALREFAGLEVPPAKSPALGDLFRAYQGGGERA